MIKQNRGSLILNTVPNAEVKQKVRVFLTKYFKNASIGKLVATVRKTPVVISKNVSGRVGKKIVSNLEKLGASASYVPEEPAADQRLPETHNTTPSKTSFSREDTQTAQFFPNQVMPNKRKASWKEKLIYHIEEVNKELWLILSMFIIVGIMNYLVTSHRILLSLYTLPTLLSAYLYGRRYATLTAMVSVFLVGLVMYLNPALLTKENEFVFMGDRWFDIVSWGAILMVTAYAMGTLYERNEARLKEVQQAYRGLIIILRYFISKDKYTENHCYRVSIYAAKIASHLGLNVTQIEDIRSAALLHDLGKLDISRELLYKAAQLTQEEFEGIKKHVDKGVQMLEVANTPLNRIIPIILAHHEKYDGSGYYTARGEEIPLEARVISLADVYDALSSDRPYRKAMSPFEAKEIIVKGSGTDFDPHVVEAFLKTFAKGEMDVPNVVV